MNILVVSSYLPYPLHSGGHVRLYNLIKELSKHHTITLICEKRPHQIEADVKALEQLCKKVITVTRKKQWSISNIVKSGTSSHSFLTTGHTSSEMRDKITEVLEQTDFDLIHCETFYVIQNIPHTSLPIVLCEHNIEYSIYQKFVDHAPILARPILSLDVTKIRKEEEASWKRATKVIAVSQEDKKVMAQKDIAATVVSNGVDTTTFTMKSLVHEQKKKEKKLLFIGDFTWLQNRDAVKFIIQEIWPQITGRSDVKLWIVGRTIPESLRTLTADPAVLFDEKSSAKSTPEIFQEASILLAPIRVGGGTSYKILESMACGTPVVTMPLSANSLGVKDGEAIMVGKTAQVLAQKTIELLQDEDLYKTITTNGRRVIEENYTWKEIAKDLESVYNKLNS